MNYVQLETHRHVKRIFKLNLENKLGLCKFEDGPCKLKVRGILSGSWQGRDRNYRRSIVVWKVLVLATPGSVVGRNYHFMRKLELHLSMVGDLVQ